MKEQGIKGATDRDGNGPRSSMRRLLLVSLVVACTIVALLITTDTFSLFCVDSSRQTLLIKYSSDNDASKGIDTSRIQSEEASKGIETSRIESEEASKGIETSIESEESIDVPSLQNKPRKWVIQSEESVDVPTLQNKPRCDFTVGRWIRSDKKPLYSGESCKQWLSGMWACRLMPGRPNFDYENYRWQPEGCDLPEFDNQEFLSRMRNKVVAFVGDSIGMQQYQSMMCMLTGGKDDTLVEDISRSYNLQKPKGAIRPDGTAHKFLETNTTIIYYWSASLCEIKPLNKSNPETHFAMHLDRPVTFLQKYLHVMDVLVLNTGHHWNKGKMIANKWVIHTDGQLVTDNRFRDMGVARNYSVHKIIAWLDDKIRKNETKAEIFVRSLSPRHFFNGDWDSGGRCDNNPVPVEEKNITGQPVVDPGAESAVAGKRVHLLNVTYASQFRDEAHISKYRPKQSGQDCLHWCLPGVPDLWNELLYAQLFFSESPTY